MALEIPQYFNYILYNDKEDVSIIKHCVTAKNITILLNLYFQLIKDLVALLSRILYEEEDENILKVCLETINVIRESEARSIFPFVEMLDTDVEIYNDRLQRRELGNSQNIIINNCIKYLAQMNYLYLLLTKNSLFPIVHLMFISCLFRIKVSYIMINKINKKYFHKFALIDLIICMFRVY